MRLKKKVNKKRQKFYLTNAKIIKNKRQYREKDKLIRVYNFLLNIFTKI